MAYSLVNPWSYGLQDYDILSKKGWNAGLDPDSGQFTVRTSDGSRIGEDAYGTELNNLLNFRQNESTRQDAFLKNAIPTFQQKRPDIWNAYSSAYGNDAAKNLYLHLGSDFGANNLLEQPDYQLSKFVSGPTDLFKNAAQNPKHFRIGPGSGYLGDFGQDFSALNPSSIGLFLDKEGKPIVGGVSSRETEHGLAKIASTMPITLGSAFMGGALGGAFPGIDVGTGAAMEAGTTGLSISKALGLTDMPSWFTSGIDKVANNVLTQGVQGKNPLDNPIGLVTPFLKGLNFGGDAISGATQVASSVPDSYWNMTANAGNTLTDAGGSMGDDFWNFWGGFDDTGSNWDFTASNPFGQGVEWAWEQPGDTYSSGFNLGSLMPSGDSLLKLGMLGLGGALGGVNGSKQAGTTTTTQTRSDVPDWALPYVQGSLARGAGINSMQGYNQVPTDLSNLAAGQLGKTIKGDYLSLMNNPQWMDLSQAMGDAYKYGTAPSRASQFERANALGSTAYAQQKGIDDQAFGRSLAGLAGQIYGQERTNQERASTIAPDWSRSYQQVPYGNEQAYQGLLRGWGGSGTNSSPYYTNPYSGVLGGLATAGSLLYGKNGMFG